MSNRRNFCGLVPGFEPRAIRLVAEIVTGQTRSTVIKTALLDLTLTLRRIRVSLMVPVRVRVRIRL